MSDDDLMARLADRSLPLTAEDLLAARALFARNVEAASRLAAWWHIDDHMSRCLDPGRRDFTNRMRTATTNTGSTGRFIERVHAGAYVPNRGLLRKPTAFFAWAMGVAACLALATGLAWRAWPSPRSNLGQDTTASIAILESIGPGTQVVRNQQLLLVHDGMALLSEDRIQVDANMGDRGPKIIFPDQTSLQMQPASTLQLWMENGAKRGRLDHGEVTCEVAHQPSGKAMKLLTNHAEVEIVGTRFRLQVDDGGTRLEVNEGLVKFTDRIAIRTVEVSAGASADTHLQPATAPLLQVANQILFSCDFEDGETPKVRDFIGKVVPGPALPGSHYCLSGEMYAEDHRIVMIRLPEHFTYHQGAVLDFDYWMNGTVLDIYAWDLTQAASIGHMMKHLSPGRWGHVTVNFTDSQSTTGQSFREGDSIVNLSIQTSPGEGSNVLYIDNVVVSLPSKTTARPTP